MDQKKYKNSSPRIKVIQKIYGSLMNPDEEIIYPKNQYKKYIKDVVSGTLERIELIEETILKHLNKDIDLNYQLNPYTIRYNKKHKSNTYNSIHIKKSNIYFRKIFLTHQ